jgi:asparagine synthase (glutamine-hydrolysing)
VPDERTSLRFEELLIEQMGDRQMNYWLRSGHHSHMSIPIEVRSPFLDHRVVEHSFRLPQSYLIRDGWLKWLLRRATQELLPEEIVWRANKRGFPFPFESWLRDSKPHFFALVDGLRVPGIDLARLRAQYDPMVRSDPRMLWRFMSVCLWQRGGLGHTSANECR